MSVDRTNWPDWVPDDPRIVGWSFEFSTATATRTNYVDVISDGCPTCGAGVVETMTLPEYRAAQP